VKTFQGGPREGLDLPAAIALLEQFLPRLGDQLLAKEQERLRRPAAAFGFFRAPQESEQTRQQRGPHFAEDRVGRVVPHLPLVLLQPRESGLGDRNRGEKGQGRDRLPAAFFALAQQFLEQIGKILCWHGWVLSNESCRQ